MTAARTAEISPPARRLRDWLVPLLLFLVSAAVQIATLQRALYNVYDEGLIVFAAQRVLDGEVPYRDFWGMYTLGQFYAVAALFWLFSPTILIEQLFSVATRAGITAIVFLWARKLGAGGYAYAAWLIVLLMFAGLGFHGFPLHQALLLSLVSTYVMLPACDAAQPGRRLAAAGFCAGLAALFRHDIGFYLLAAQALALGFIVFGAGAQARHGRTARLAGMLLALGAGALAVIVPAAIFLLAQVPIRDIWFNLFYAPAVIYPAVRGLPFPALPNPLALWSGAVPLQLLSEAAGVYLPFVAAPAAFIYLAATRGAHGSHARIRFGILLLALFALIASTKGLVRVSTVHFVQSTIPAVVIACVLFARVGGAMPRRAAAVVATAVLGCAIVAATAREALINVSQNLDLVRALRNETGLRLGLPRICAPPPGIPRARCYVPNGEDAQVIALIRSRTQPGEPIYVGLRRHDRVFVNNILMYFLAERPSVTKWHEVHPGIHTSAPVQLEMIEEFKARNVRLLVLSHGWEEVRENNGSSVSSGVTLLDDYIRANFTETDRIGTSAIWQRR